MASGNGVGKRIAFVVGNSAYQHIGYLDDPRRDASAMAAALKDLGFDDVVAAIDLGRANLIAKLKEFYAKLSKDDTGLLFYAGHGVQVWGRNYLLPCDALIHVASDLRNNAIPLDDVVRTISGRTRARLLVLDACRNGLVGGESGGFTRGTRSVAIGSDIADVGQGLAKITAAPGTFVAYATEPGNFAYEGEGDNSPFTTALLRHMTRPGLALDDIMMEVRVEVLDATKGKQLPWSESALTQRFLFKEGPASSTPRDFEQEYWDRVKETHNPDFLESFLHQFPDGRFAGEARARIGGVRARKEAADWQAARSTDTIAALADFVRRYPNSKEAAAARTRLFLRQLWRGSSILGAGVAGTIILAIVLMGALFVGLVLGGMYKSSEWLAEMAKNPDQLVIPILYRLLFVLAPSVMFGVLLWAGLARYASRPLVRATLSCGIAVVPAITFQTGLRVLSPWAPEVMVSHVEAQQELAAKVAVDRRDPRHKEDAAFKQEAAERERALSLARESTFAVRVYYPLAAAVLAGLASFGTLLLTSLAISGKRGLAAWETPILGGTLSAVIGVTTLYFLTVDHPWDVIAITSYACWGSIGAFLALGLSRAAAFSETG